MYYNKTNVWGHRIPTPQSIILNDGLYPQIGRLLSKILALIGPDSVSIENFLKLAIESAKRDLDAPLVVYERDLKASLATQIAPQKLEHALIDRANIIYREIMPLLSGDSMLDIGCGNGLIANLASCCFKQVQLLDVVPYVSKEVRFPFVLYTEGQPLPVYELFDTVLVLTVLHHSNDPVGLLKLAWAATRNRLIIIESVVGVHHREPHAKYDLVDSCDQDQIAYAAFVDWFYNRVLHDDIPVPYNFTTPERWQSTFLQHNMPLAQTVYLGQDIDIGPEYHLLFVLQR